MYGEENFDKCNDLIDIFQLRKKVIERDQGFHDYVFSFSEMRMVAYIQYVLKILQIFYLFPRFSELSET